MRHRSMRALHAYWNQLRGPRLAPTRGEINPRALAPHLGDIFLLEGAPEDFRFRLAGSRMVETMQRALTNQPFHAIWAERSREEAERFIQIVSEDAEPLLIGTRLASLETAPPAPLRNLRFAPASPTERRRAMSGHGELILLPLIHNGKVGARILGAFALMNPADAEDSAPKVLDITGSRMLARQPSLSAPLGLIHADLADRVISTHGHLVLLRGEKADPA